MPTIRCPYRGPCPAACALHIACYAVLLMSISLTASAQEQSQPPQTPPQEESKPPDASVEPERWNLYYQATSIGDEHGTFHAPYARPAQPGRIIPSTMSRSQPLCSSACGSNKTPYLCSIRRSPAEKDSAASTASPIRPMERFRA